jgi:thiol-disulfide isomerase/thioredoxin
VKLLLLVLLSLGSLCAAGPLTEVDEAGYARLVESHKGKVVLVNFWATWCPPCLAELPDLVKLEQRLKAKGFQLVYVSADDPDENATAHKLLTSKGVASRSYLKAAKNDEKFINAIDAKWSGAVPALFLYDRQGRKVKSFIGETPVAELEAAIRKVL